MRSTAELMAVLREHGWKVTAQRVAVYEALRDCGTHPTADEVFAIATARIGTISIRSVYQTLHELAELGEVRAVHIVPGAARFDTNTTHHDHLVCMQCGRVEEFYDAEIEKRQIKVAKDRGFEISEHALYLYADCTKPRCPHRKTADPN